MTGKFSTVPRNAQRCAGFTLLELLVAIAIFAVVAAMAYGGLSSVLRARSSSDAGALQLRALQQSFMLLGRDLAELAPRPVRDEYGDRKAAFLGGSDWIEFTRAGWANPTAQPRSDLQRVAFARRDKRWVMATWQVLDRAQDSAPLETNLLDNISSLRLRYLDANSHWQESWPPLDNNGSAATEAAPPRAVELTLELEQWGTVTRLFRLPGTNP